MRDVSATFEHLNILEQCTAYTFNNRRNQIIHNYHKWMNELMNEWMIDLGV